LLTATPMILQASSSASERWMSELTSKKGIGNISDWTRAFAVSLLGSLVLRLSQACPSLLKHLNVLTKNVISVMRDCLVSLPHFNLTVVVSVSLLSKQTLYWSPFLSSSFSRESFPLSAALKALFSLMDIALESDGSGANHAIVALASADALRSILGSFSCWNGLRESLKEESLRSLVSFYVRAKGDNSDGCKATIIALMSERHILDRFVASPNLGSVFLSHTISSLSNDADTMLLSLKWGIRSFLQKMLHVLGYNEGLTQSSDKEEKSLSQLTSLVTEAFSLYLNSKGLSKVIPPISAVSATTVNRSQLIGCMYSSSLASPLEDFYGDLGLLEATVNSLCGLSKS